MDGKLASRVTATLMPRDKREAVPIIRGLINEVEVYLQQYADQAGEVKLRSPDELLLARRKIADAVELSEAFELTVIGEKARQVERQTGDTLAIWGEQRKRMIDSMLASGDDKLAPDFNQWVEEYRLCFPDKETMISDWRRQKSVVETPGRFEQDYQESESKVAKLQDQAQALYDTDPVNNEGSAIGKMRRAYEEAKRLADNYPDEQVAQDLAAEAKNLYEKRKEAWSKSLVTSARFAQFERVRRQWEQAKRAGEERVVSYEAVLDEEGDLVFGFEEGEEILTLVEGEPIAIDEALSRLSDIEFKYADTKTSQYIHLADRQMEVNPQGAIDSLKEFRAQYSNVLRETHKRRLDRKLQDYQVRLSRRHKAADLLERARTEANAAEAWRSLLKAESIDDDLPGLENAKAEIGRQLQVVIEKEVLPEYHEIGILDDRGPDSWDSRIAFLSDLQSLISGYQPLAQLHDELSRITINLSDYRDFDAEINAKLPEIQSKLRETPQEADEELETLEYKLIKLQRTTLYPAVRSTRQLINAHLNMSSQMRVWVSEIDEEDKLLQNLAAIETAVKEFSHLKDEELDRIHKRYQARAMLSTLETDREFGQLSDGLYAELAAIETISTLFQEANETDQGLIRKVNTLSRWLIQKKRDYDKIVKRLEPLHEHIEAGEFQVADSLLEILFGLYPNDPTLVQRKSRMEIEWRFHLMEKLTQEMAVLEKVRTTRDLDELREILNGIGKLQELAGESVVQRFQELRAYCYLGLARAEPSQTRYWLEHAEEAAPEGSTAYGHVRAGLIELQREDDFSELAQESDDQKRVLKLEKMRVRYPDDVEVLELLADLYLQREEPLKAQSIVEHMNLLQRRGKVKNLNIAGRASKVKELIKIHEWKRSVLEQLDPEASLESLKSVSQMMAEAPLKPGADHYDLLEEWYETQKRDFAAVVLRQGKDVRDRGADLVDTCDKMLRVWLFVPQAQEAKDSLDELGRYSLDLQRELEQEARDTSGRVEDARDWLNQQIKRVEGLIGRARQVSRILEIYYDRAGGAEERREKSISLREQIDALTAHKRELSRLRSELAALQSDWREARESRDPNDRRWDGLERGVNALQTGTGEYGALRRLRQHEQVKYLFNQVMKSREDQRRLKDLFEELRGLVDQELYQAALQVVGKIRAIEDWDKYRFEEDLKSVTKIPGPVTMASLEEFMLERAKLVEEASHLVSTHTRRLPHWSDTQGLWDLSARERLLNHSETTEVLQKVQSGQEQEVHEAVVSYRRMAQHILAELPSRSTWKEENTVKGAVRNSLREGKWEDAIVYCWQAAFNQPDQETKLREEFRRLRNAANANNNPGPFVKRAKELAASLENPDEEHLFSVGSWHYFLKVSARFSEVLPEGSSNPRIGLELAHLEMIRSDVQGWLVEAGEEIQEIAKLFRQFTAHYITAQQSLNRLNSMRWQRFRPREVSRIVMSGQLAYNECRRICPDYPYPHSLRERFEGHYRS